MRPVGSSEHEVAHNRCLVFSITAGVVLATVLACALRARNSGQHSQALLKAKDPGFGSIVIWRLPHKN